MKYIVLFYDEYVGNIYDEYSKIFSSKKEAKKYLNKVNKEWAEANMCELKNLGDYYIIIKEN